MTNRPTFDAKQFLVDNFENPDKELAFLERYGVADLTRQAVYKHFVRGSIPADLLPVLLALLEIENGAPVSLTKWLK